MILNFETWNLHWDGCTGQTTDSSKNLCGEHSGTNRKYFGQTNHSTMTFCVSLLVQDLQMCFEFKLQRYFILAIFSQVDFRCFEISPQSQNSKKQKINLTFLLLNCIRGVLQYQCPCSCFRIQDDFELCYQERNLLSEGMTLNVKEIKCSHQLFLILNNISLFKTEFILWLLH